MKISRTFVVGAVCVILSGCFVSAKKIPEQEVLVKTEYIVRVPPAEMLELPQRPAPIDTSTASQRDVALWIARYNEYVLSVESRFKQVAKFLTNPPE